MRVFFRKLFDCIAPPEITIKLKPCGEVVKEQLQLIKTRFRGVTVEDYVIMPDHIHAVIFLHRQAGGASPSPTSSRFAQTARRREEIYIKVRSDREFSPKASPFGRGGSRRLTERALHQSSLKSRVSTETRGRGGACSSRFFTIHQSPHKL